MRKVDQMRHPKPGRLIARILVAGALIAAIAAATRPLQAQDASVNGQDACSLSCQQAYQSCKNGCDPGDSSCTDGCARDLRQCMSNCN